MNKLKPCPFCGGEAKIAQFDLNPESILNHMCIIGCNRINDALCPGYVNKCAPFYTSEELAIRMWNNRDGKGSEV